MRALEAERKKRIFQKNSERVQPRRYLKFENRYGAALPKQSILANQLQNWISSLIKQLVTNQ